MGLFSNKNEHATEPLLSRSVPPVFTITKRRLKKLESIRLVREQRENGKQELAYNARPLVLCGIPLRRPRKEQLAYRSRNGNFSLNITGHPRLGLPFGQDRLIPIWVATLAVQQKNRTVRFDNPSQFLDFFELPKNGYHFKRVVQGSERIFGSTIFFGADEQRQQAVVSNWARFHFFDRIQLWYNREQFPQALPGDGCENVIAFK